MARVVVIGAGLTGLLCAQVLSRRGHGVLVLEAADTLGGQIQTDRSDGYVTELGAEGFVASSEALPRVARELGIHAELVGQSQTRSLGYRAGELHELAPGEAARFLGFQVSRDDTGQGIRTFRNGMGRLIDALASALAARVEIRSSQPVASVTRKARGYRIVLASGSSIDADRVVVATSARAASQLLQGAFGATASELTLGKLLSSVTVSLAWDRAAVPHALDATGIVFAAGDQEHGVRACTFTTSKFPARAPESKASIRVFFRPEDNELKLLADAAYTRRAATILTRVLGIHAAAERSWVSRWQDALPAHDPAQKDRVALLEKVLSGTGIALAGSAFHGSGIDAAVRSALSIEDRL
ncbi:MAG TPA: FAD-dependent oxidoreductase [Polyangiales bacterium]